MEIIYHHRTQGKGAEGVHINETVKAFRETNHRVNVVSLLKGNISGYNKAKEMNSSKSIMTDVLVNTLKFVSKYTHEAVFEIMEFLYNFLSFPFLVYKIKKYHPSFIYERYSLFMFSGVVAAKLLHIPIILEVNDSAIVFRVRPLYFKKIARFIESKIFKNCSGLVFISNEFLDLVKNEYGSKIADSIILPNAANPDIFDPNICDASAFHDKYNLANKIVCGYVGAFVRWHGINWFVKCIAPKLKNSNLVLLLVGDGDCLIEIENYISEYNLNENVIITGRVRHSDVANLISLMDFSILPDSNEYGSPMKIFEFMSMGVPVVAPNYSPIKEVIEDNKTGWLFESKNREDAVHKTLDAANNIDRCKEIGINAREYILSQRTWKKNTNDIISLFNKIKNHD